MTLDPLGDDELAKRAEQTGAPLPSDFATTGHQFERWISGGVAPLIGLNMFLFGCLELGRMDEASAAYAALTSCALGVVAIVAVLRSGKALVPSYADYLAVGLAALLLATALSSPWLTPFLALSIGVALFAAVLRRRVQGRSFALLGCWLLPVLKQAAVPRPILIASVLLGPAAVLLVRRKLLGPAFVLVAIVLVQAGMELAEDGQGATLSVVMCGLALALALLYELGTPIREFSTFRLLVGQLPVVVALGLLVWSTLPDSLTGRGTVWVLAFAIIVFQSLRTYFERAAVPARLAWVGVALGFAVVAETDLVGADSIACQLVAIAGGLHIVAIVLQASALADLGILVLLAVLGALAIPDVATSTTLVTSLTLTGAALVFASRRFPVAPPLPWWSGFLRKRHAELVGQALARVAKRVSDFALVKLVFGWVSVVVLWTRFGLAAASRSDVRPVVNLAGHATLAIFTTQRLVEWIAARLPQHDAVFEPTLRTVLCCAYGVALVARGRRTGRFFSRLLGLGIALFPAVSSALHVRSVVVDELAWLLMTTGSALAMIGFLVKQPKTVLAAAPDHTGSPS